MTIKLPLLFVLSLGLSFAARTQTYIMNGNPINTCSGAFYDSGGNTANYSNNESLITTICSDGSNGTHIQLKFSGTDLAAGDLLCFYDGPNTSAPQLACSDDFPAGQPFIVQATAQNPSGCITLQFISNGSGTATGWAAAISCVASCQTVLADLVSTNPAIVPADTGWIDVCPGERIFFNGTGIYPQNNFAYQQSDLTTSFEWNFGDGDISYGPNTSHKFDEPGGYYVQLVLTDVQGCRSTNLINQRVRVAPRPHFNLASAIDQTICAKDTIHLSAAVANYSGQNLAVTPGTQAFTVEGSRSDSLALPDGTGIPYETSVYFTEFSPGQVLTDPNDLESICVNMEHSWMRDMEISLTCPNGQSIVLHNFAGQTGGQVYLGVPNDADGFNPVPGQGFDYCWTPTATNPTWIQYANTVLGGNGTLPSGDYTPFDPISDLIGCPLNGEWTITVTDLWPIDNGFIFSWGLKFKDLLYPDIEVFQPQFVSWGWNNHPSIFYYSQDSIAAVPLNAGTAGYVFKVTDEFGCTWDTLVNIAILPFLHPDCYTCSYNYLPLRDTAVCQGSPAAFNGSSTTPATQEVRFEAFPDYPLGNSNHPHVNPYKSPINVNSVGYNTLTSPLTQITSICIDIETDFDADLNIALRSPDGKLIDLSSGNGGAGDNYKITCFSPTATVPITSGTAPFNGTYRPEGPWTALNGAVVNGDWQLVVSDGFGINQLGKVKWWSIGFNFTDVINYTWTNAASLSCNNCPTPQATPNTSTTYIMTATNSLGCVYKDTAKVDILQFFPAPANLTPVLGAGSIQWIWDPIPGATAYEVSINGGPWIPSNGGASHLVSGLINGDNVAIQVRAVSNNVNCPPAISSATQMYVLCTMSADLNSTTPTTCNGAANGSAIISVSNATPPVTFLPDGNGPGQNNGDLLNMFTAGNHFVIVIDGMGCRDTVPFVINEPAPLQLSVNSVNILCNGGNSGSATASATGGTGTLTFTWKPCSGGNTVLGPSNVNLTAGCYAVTVTDANGCTAAQQVTLTQPPAFTFQTFQDSVSCFGGSDGIARIQVTGATPPYTYAWNGGGNTDTKSNVAAGFHTVAVTDANGCQAVTLVQVLQPPLLKLDSIMAKAVSCFGDSNGSATAFPSGGTAPYSYIWDDSGAQNTKKALNLPAGAYAVTITDHNGCTVLGNTTISTPTALVVNITGSSDELCENACDGTASVLASGSGAQYTYAWSAGVSPSNTSTPGNLCAGNYTVTVQDDRGCTQTGSVTIQAATPLTVSASLTDPSCAGKTDGSIALQAGGGAGNLTYAWSTGASSANLNNVTCGSYTVTITDGNSCTRTATYTLVCPPGMTANPLASTPVSCFGGNNGALSVVVQGGTGTLSYVWSAPGAPVGSSVQGLAAGNYTVTITDGNGCSISATGNVGSPTDINIAFTPTNIACFGASTGSLTAAAQGGTPGYTYVWNTGPGGGTLPNLAAGTYTVTVTDQNGCTKSAVAPALTQPASAVLPLITQTKQACFNQSSGEASASASGGAGGYSFVWSQGSNGPLATGLDATTYTVTATDASGCTGAASIQIDELDSILVNVAFSPPSCYGQSNGVAAINFIQGGAGNGDTLQYTYQWNVPNVGSVTVLQNLAGDQTYRLTVTDAQGCRGTFNLFLPQPPEIQLQTSVNHVSCYAARDGAAQVVSVQQAVLPIAYTWSNNIFTAANNNLGAGLYTVTVTDSEGCTKSASLEVRQPDSLRVDFTIKEILCSQGNDGSISAVVTGGTPVYQFNWSTGAQAGAINNLGSGMYSISITDANGCTLADTVVLQEPDTILISLVKKDPSCDGFKNGRIKINVTGGKQPFRYQLNGGNFGGSSTFVGLAQGPYQIAIKDDNGCIVTLNDSLTAPPLMSVDLGSDTTIVFGQSVLLDPLVTNGAAPLTYEWTSNLVDSLKCQDPPLCSSQLVTPPFSNSFLLTVVDTNGCIARDEIRIFVEKPRGVFVPTGFSPNTDGNNDLLVVHGLSEHVKSILVFRLFDRWGELVYEDTNFAVNDPTRGWDGTFRGKDCDPGVFVWYLEVEYKDGYRETLSGNTMLVR